MYTHHNLGAWIKSDLLLNRLAISLTSKLLALKGGVCKYNVALLCSGIVRVTL
jgi:hypothetical protein